MASVEDLDAPALPALLALLEEGPLNMRRFANAADVSPATARVLLAKLLDLRLVEVEREARGATEVATVSLTTVGRAVATHVREIDAILAGRRRN